MEKVKEINVPKSIFDDNNIRQNTTYQEEESNIHTEELQEFITKVPSWLLRWGITVSFAVALLLVVISVFIRYPDTIKADFKLNTYIEPASVNASNEGRITKLLVKQGAVVKQGQSLAIISNANDVHEYQLLTAPAPGKIGFIGILEQGTYVKANQEVFIIHPDDEAFFGIVQIPANSVEQLKIGQRVLINLDNHPTDEYGQLTGAISYIADEPNKDKLFSVKVALNNTSVKRRLVLKRWITGNAEIITENISLKNRISKSLLKGLY